MNAMLLLRIATIGASAFIAATVSHAATYVVTANGWGAAQNAAVTSSGGTVLRAHAGAGVATVQSDAADFLQKLRAKSAIASVARDRSVRWNPEPVTAPGTEFVSRELWNADYLWRADYLWNADFLWNADYMWRADYLWNADYLWSADYMWRADYLWRGDYLWRADFMPAFVDPTPDTLFPLQWAPRAIEADAAWGMGYRGGGVRVAVLDGGIYGAHPDLAANVDVARAASFVPGQAWNTDTGSFWHGTHVAGIIAAVDNNLGVIGIAPEATIVPVKVLHAGSGDFDWVIQGILYAATPIAQGGGGAHVINMSLGALIPRNEEGVAELMAALNRAINHAAQQGVLVVSAVGNDALDLDHAGNVFVAPAENGNGLGISATGPIGWATGQSNFSNPASYTNYGNSAVHVAAPGGDFVYPGNENCTMPVVGGSITRPCWVFDLVLSTSRAGWSWAAGTSMATPAASAVAALIKQKYPNISVGQLKNRLAQSATDEGKPGADPYYGRGWVNARRAVE